MKRVAGIYQICCSVSGNAYCGSSVNIWGRWENHRWHLARGTHHCHALQSAWNKHGAQAFELSILERCSERRLRAREQHWLDTRRFVYNSCQTVYPYPTVEQRAEARRHILRLNQLLWTDARREAARMRMKARVRRPTSRKTRRKQSVAAKERVRKARIAGQPHPWLIHRQRNPLPKPEPCACGCGGLVRRGRTFLRGHWLRVNNPAVKDRTCSILSL